jgi:hypothetical protein
MITGSRFAGVCFAITYMALLAPSRATAQAVLYQIPGTDAGGGPHVKIVTLSINGAEAIAIGTPDHDEPGLPGAGKVEVYSARTATLLYTVTGSGAGDRYGVRVAHGDVNGDGNDDLIVGADQGGVGGYVDVLNASDGSLIETVVESSSAAAIGGGAIVLTEDFDGDGIHELAVGSPLEDSAVLPKTGALHVISSSTGSDIATIYGGSTGAQFGQSGVDMGAEDLDGDGIADLVIDAPVDGGFGSVSCYSGADFHLIWQTFGVVAGEEFGTAITELGADFDGDGIPDLAAGVVWAGLPPCPPGHVELLSGASGSVINDLASTEIDNEFGESLDSYDVDEDGFPELLVGAPGADAGGVDRGSVAAFKWDTTLVPPAFVQIAEVVGTSDGDELGDSIRQYCCGLGSSGMDGLAVTLPGSDTGAVDGGAVAICSLIGSVASATNYGTGWSGTLGVPAIFASNPPKLGAALTVHVDNSSPAATAGLLFVGFAQASIPTRAGGTILVAAPWILGLLPLPIGGLDINATMPIDLLLCGFEIDLQCLESDAGASRKISFTPGLSLLLGG